MPPGRKPTEKIQIPRPDALDPELKDVGGSNSDDVNQTLAQQVVEAQWRPNAMDDARSQQVATASLMSMVGLKPQDEAEGMLIGQMIAAHAAAMECYRRAMIMEQSFEGREQNLRFADRLSRTYTMQLDALKRYRKTADQTVRIERVIVKDGSQAIIGNVTKGGGGNVENGSQSHASELTDERGTEVRCEDAFGQAVPVAGGARQEAVPHARRD
jgi:hypothetical protein